MYGILSARKFENPIVTSPDFLFNHVHLLKMQANNFNTNCEYIEKNVDNQTSQFQLLNGPSSYNEAFSEILLFLRKICAVKRFKEVEMCIEMFVLNRL